MTQGRTLVVLAALLSTSAASYMVGIGIADITGPPVEVTFMGYAQLEQRGTGLHLRQFSRAYIFQDDDGSRLVFTSIDAAMIGNGLRRDVISKLRKEFGDMYSERNVMISATHTHSGPGGFMQDFLFDISSLGFVRQTYNALLSGIVQSIRRAHLSMQPARLFLSQGELLGVSINRSPTAYLANPASERSRYEHDVDKTMVQLRIETPSGRPLGAINWYAVHPTSMNNTNTLVSSDNVGYAAILLEKQFNGGAMPGKGPFISAFSSSNLGDVSPNTAGPRCKETGRSCDPLSSTCARAPDGRQEHCYSPGPGTDMFDSTRIVAKRLAGKASELWRSSNAREVTGPIAFAHQWVDMPKQTAEYVDPETGATTTVRGCLPAMGYSFGAGTTDGPGAFAFQQGTRSSNSLWDTVRDFLATPTQDDVACHAPKPILLMTGRMTFPFEWQPQVVSTHLGRVGNLVLMCVPGEFTTMSGRRMRDAMRQVFGQDTTPVLAGLCNTYSDYVATPEEYKVQRYEGASTIFGPHTLTLYLQQYRKLAQSILSRSTMTPGPTPPDLSKGLIQLTPGVVYDMPSWQSRFGYVMQQPPATARPGDTVTATFVAGNPRNNLQHGGSYLAVEKKDPYTGNWSVIATDADWETKFLWRRTSTPLGMSEATVVWSVPEDAEPGVYRLRHSGHSKYILGGVFPYSGSTQPITVSPHLPRSQAQPPNVRLACVAAGSCQHVHSSL
ncbi:neutral ceramidase-like isoform X1 [Schistocerca serialis cubense]|uniref:neutral ceramidase-like isoform X1 n=1 Tax=Schistocerca serialis cubense TaxID=2023355 RepID=UPI00214F11A2|nr:neutral ceramidase-like isoform X1 [Schistocerca serialis cubense]XP_049948669.1 neutral ceramidase-like isoform X1 [Schistocerca serialis cubense]